MSSAKLTKKVIDIAVSTLKNAKSAPEGAVKVDLVQGVCKRGKFEVLSFKDKNGDLIERCIDYKKGKNTTSYLRKYHNYWLDMEKNRCVDQYEYINEKAAGIKSQTIKSNVGNKFWKFEQQYGQNIDVHTISYLESGQKSKSIVYGTFWNGEKPCNITSIGTEGKNFQSQNMEYLPLIGDSASGFSIDKKVYHISRIQEKKYDLEGITPSVKRVSSKELQDGCDDGRVALGECGINGQINICQDVYNSRRLLGYLGHEYKHASELSLLTRLEESAEEFRVQTAEQKAEIEAHFPGITDFARRSMARGIIPNDSEFGRKLKEIGETWDWGHKLPWDKRPQEIRANIAKEEELKKLDDLLNNLVQFFKAKIKPKLDSKFDL